VLRSAGRTQAGIFKVEPPQDRKDQDDGCFSANRRKVLML
jgi:hypothetical protein